MKKETAIKAIERLTTEDVRKELYYQLWEESNKADSFELVSTIITKMNEAGEPPEEWGLLDKIAFIAAGANINGFMNGYELGVQAAILALDDVSSK